MPSLHPRENFPDGPLEQRTCDELTKLVRKLRWMGFEEEANLAQVRLTKIARAGSVLTMPRETD